VSGWSSQVVIADQLIIEGANDYLLIYNGTPGVGTLVMSMAAMAGTDPYGNAIAAGFAVYNGATVEYQVDLSGDVTIGSTATGGFQFQPGATPAFKMFDNSGNLAVDFDADTGVVTLLQNSGLTFVQINGALQGIAMGDITGAGQLPTTAQVADAAQVFPSLNLLGLQGAASTGSPDASAVFLEAGAANTGTGNASCPNVTMRSADLTSDVDVFVSGSVIKTDRTNSNNPFTRQTPTLGTGWAQGPQGGSFASLQFWRDAFDNLMVGGTCHSTSNAPNATIFTLPSTNGYRPASNWRIPCVANAAGSFSAHALEVDSNGNVSVQPAFTVANADLYVDATIPLGHIS
jgi:hypothetical protein